jgi:hypothetical protein
MTCERPECGFAVCPIALERYREAVGTGSIEESEIPDCLRSMGLFELSHDRESLIPVAPVTVAGRILREHEREISLRGQTILRLSSSFRELEVEYESGIRGFQPPVATLYDDGAIADVVRTSLSTSKEALIALSGTYPLWREISSMFIRRNPPVADNQATLRLLCQHNSHVLTDLADNLDISTWFTTQVRSLDEVPIEFVVCDHEVTYITMRLDYSNVVEIRHPTIVESLVDTFGYLWSRGVVMDPLRGELTKEINDDVETSIMRRLVNGDTEEKIARSLSMSRRTVAAYVARISKRVGSKSRTQLGYLIAEHKLLDVR